jgi:hypothetical protein
MVHARRAPDPPNLAQFLQQDTVEVRLTRPVSPGAGCFRLSAHWSAFPFEYRRVDSGYPCHAEEPEGGLIHPLTVKSGTESYLAVFCRGGWSKSAGSAPRRTLGWHQGTPPGDRVPLPCYARQCPLGPRRWGRWFSAYATVRCRHTAWH